MAFKNYALKAVSLVIFGLPIEDGRAEGTFVKLTMPEKYSATPDGSGGVTRYQMSNNVITAEVTLKSSSSEHQKLSAIYTADTNAQNGAGVGVFLLKDNNGATLVSSDKCWISKAPDWEFGEEVKELTWTFQMKEGVTVFGGN